MVRFQRGSPYWIYQHRAPGVFLNKQNVSKSLLEDYALALKLQMTRRWGAIQLLKTKAHMFKLVIFFFAAVSFFSLDAKKKDVPQVGSIAPEFSCMGDDGSIHNLSNYKGKVVVLFFYPMDGSPYCTQEAQGFKDNFKLFKDNDIVILGISCDSVKDHSAFKAKYNLPFTLLSDPKSKVFKLYGLKGVMFNGRITYVIDKDGKIIEIFSSINPGSHAQEALRFLGIKNSIESSKTCTIK